MYVCVCLSLSVPQTHLTNQTQSCTKHTFQTKKMKDATILHYTHTNLSYHPNALLASYLAFSPPLPFVPRITSTLPTA